MDEMGLQDPLELQERLVVEDDLVEVLEIASARVKAVSNRAGWEARIMLQAGESFLLHCGNQGPIMHKCRSAVMIEGRDAENLHPLRRGCTRRGRGLSPAPR